jgi:hypothetical protein
MIHESIMAEDLIVSDAGKQSKRASKGAAAFQMTSMEWEEKLTERELKPIRKKRKQNPALFLNVAGFFIHRKVYPRNSQWIFSRLSKIKNRHFANPYYISRNHALHPPMTCRFPP